MVPFLGCWDHPLSMNSVRVVVVDDHRMVSDALALRIDEEPDMRVVARATTAATAEEAVRRFKPDLAIVDLELGRENAVHLLSRLVVAHPGVGLVALTEANDGRALCAAVRAGACGFVTKNSGADELLDAIRRVACHEGWVPPPLLKHLLGELRRSAPRLTVEEQRVASLTSREREVLSLLVRGMGRFEIAHQLRLSTNTVRTHTQNLITKLGVHSTLEAVSLALRSGLRPDGDS